MKNMHDVVKSLGSDKVKERQEALATIREVFAQEGAVEKFATENGGVQQKNFLLIYQAIFRVIGKEKDAAVRGTISKGVSITAALRRLSDAASALRWLIERTVHLLNAAVATTCIKHLLKILLDSQVVFDTVALDFSKVLRCILAYTPHLDHLTEGLWLEVVSLAFNVILGDSLQTKLVGDDEMEVMNEVDSEMYVDESDDAREQVVGKGKKRSRHDATPLPILSPRKQKPEKQRRNVVVSVSHEQVELTHVLRLLLSAPNAPLLPVHRVPTHSDKAEEEKDEEEDEEEEEEEEDEEDVASAILHRLQRFLEVYPADSSLLRDYIATLSAVLDHLSFNMVIAIQKFARSTWDGLIGLWGTKDKALKEGLLIVLRQLFPFLTCPAIFEDKLPPFDCGEGLGRLWHLLDGEAENRWGVDGLSLDALRLEISHSRNDGNFVAKTFRAGWNFDANQALSWAILELQADCAATLFHLSESIQATRSDMKRMKMENPVVALLHSIQAKHTTHVRSYHLQVLLFFLDRHWHVLHDALQANVVDILVQFIAFDDVSVQSWVFLNIAAIAYSEGRRATDSKATSISSDKWDTIWTHTLRRVNVPGVCRAACHAGYTLLMTCQNHTKFTQSPVSNHRILLEVEALLKDMDVQGPSYPFDSVCSFLALCLVIAAQDVRLYRMRLEDKVLTWFADSWKIFGNRMKMVPYTMPDIVQLLAAVCGLSRCSLTRSHVLLPRTAVVDHIVQENEVKIIRDFALHAKVPPITCRVMNQSRGQNQTPIERKDTSQITPPRGRERKISAFFSRSIENLAADWETLKEQNPTAEMARRSLDFALTAIVFESLLAFNGTSVNRQVLQNAGKIVSIITPLLLKQIWILPEKLLVAQSFAQLVLDAGCSQDAFFREALISPGMYSGIQEQLLPRLTQDNTTESRAEDEHLAFLRQIWQNQDVQEIFAPVVLCLRTLLQRLLCQSTGSQETAMDVDDKDGFAPIRTATRQNKTADTLNATDTELLERLLETCISFIACGPYLQSTAQEATRDVDLAQLVMKCEDPDKFRIACPILFRFVRQRIFYPSLKTFHSCLIKFGNILRGYNYSKQQAVIIACLDFLNSTLGAWKADDQLANDVQLDLQEIYHWLSGLLVKRSCRSWVLRDAIARFLGQYLANDPSQESWIKASGDPSALQDRLPTSLLPRLNCDQDIRIRFRAAFINASLFSITHHFKQGPLKLYELMKRFFPPHLERYEQMLTRLLALGNILVASAAVRRGAYWHMLETCIHSSSYSYASHIEAILVAVSQSLGMSSLSVLSEAYASQLAFSLRQLDADFLRFPPHLLGYHDRKQCAEATFRAFTPFNLLTNGVKLFETHCKLLQKDSVNGLHECFGNVVGLQLANWMDQYAEPPEEEHFKETFEFVQGFIPPFEDNLDVITTTVLKSLGDQNFSGINSDSIVSVLQSLDPKMASTFQSVSRYRIFDPLRSHPPNRPAFTASVVLRSLQWLSTRWGRFSSHTTYHVLHQLMNEVNKTPLVNEQLRLVNAMSLWIAFRQEDVTESTIVDTLIHGATFLLSQSDLARAAQSILDWAFARYPQPNSWKESRLPNALVQIRCIAQDFCSEVTNPAISVLGEELITWIDSQMNDFARKSAYRKLVLKVLPTWPQQPSSAVAKLYDEISVYDLTSILEDHRITSNKFRLVSRLQECASLRVSDEQQFSKIHFWRLKECIPSQNQLQDGDIDAFACLLSFYHGQVGSLNIEQPDMLSPRNRHRNVRKKNMDDPVDRARDAIISGLLLMLDDDEPSRVFNAYDTLRLAMSVSTSRNSSLLISPEYRKDLEYLKMYKQPSVHRIVPNIQEALRSEQYVECSINFSQWMSQLSTLLADSLTSVDPVFGQFSSILASDVGFAEQVIPILVHTTLQVERQGKNSLHPVRDALSQYFAMILSSALTDIRCTHSIVDIILHLRNFLPGKSDALAYNKWLNIDFSLLAKSAILCGAYTTALLFVELAAEHKGIFEADNNATEQVLYEIYSHIDEPDGFYGIKTQDLQKFLLKRFHHEKQWDKAFRFHAAALEAERYQNTEQMGLLQSFHAFGFDHLAMDTLRRFRESTSGLPPSSMNYKLGWRTETWDLPEHEGDAMGSALYRALRAIHRERDTKVLDYTLRTALYDTMEHLRSLGSENLVEIRLACRDLMCLSEILQWRRQYAEIFLKADPLPNELQNFVKIDDEFDFPDLEAIMATRISFIRSERQREERHQVGSMISPTLRGLIDSETRCLLRLSQAARLSDQVQIALNSVVRARKLNKNQTTDVNEEFANVLWLQKEETLAVQFLQSVLDDMDRINAQDVPRQALLLSRLGTWTSEACLAKPADIWENCFSRSISLLGTIQTTSPDLEITKATIYRECAMFSERQFHSVLKSPDALRWKLYVDRKKNEIEFRSKEITRTQSTSVKSKLQHDQDRAQKLLQEDSELFKKHNELRESLLQQAIEMHSRCLETSNNFDDDSTIRFCSLWFANFDDASIVDAVSSALDRIPSRKLVPLAHQITARLLNSSTNILSPIQQILQRLVTKMCQDHPFHTLYQVYCISDRPPSQDRRQSGRFSQSTQTERGAAATSILERLRADEKAGNPVTDVELLCNAYVQWAMYPIKKNPNFSGKPRDPRGFNIPESQRILKIVKIKVPVSTVRTPLDSTLKYDNCVWIDRYDRYFWTAGGNNAPKISFCYGSDGQKYKQLFKGEGNDDLRQDAVMEQVFDLVNGLLREDRETKRRDLRVRGYKVIPLSGQAGLLEFVGNTSPLKDWLQKAHLLYRPNDMKPDEVYHKMKEHQGMFKHRPDKELEFYLTMRRRFQPVMRHCFTEKHKTPLAWFTMRLNYVRSVATTSIVGHVLGLGDRHVSNILLDNMTGEVVHIDLGIAFDQGKLLPVPERVPFRMTPDMVDGMGITGTAGVFQRCAEETLRVLRDQSGVIMTVLEVFKHDPLHSWTASEIKVKQAQSEVPTTPSVVSTNDTSKFNIGIGIDMSSGTADEAADRALSSVARKLDKSLSVQSTVNELIAEATDPINIATIFVGWSPWY